MYVIHCDGGLRDYPHCVSIGIHILNSTNGKVDKYFKLISLDGYCDNNEAEFMAVFHTLEKIKDMEIHKQVITLNTDSKTIINMLNCYGNYKDKHLKKLCSKLRKKLREYPKLKIKWVSRHENRLAHNLSEQAINQYMREKYIEEALIQFINNRQYKVLSSQGNKFYTVDLKNYKCTCNYYKFQKYDIIEKCKHIKAVERMLNKVIE